jgi:hypothetical protein
MVLEVGHGPPHRLARFLGTYWLGSPPKQYRFRPVPVGTDAHEGGKGGVFPQGGSRRANLPRTPSGAQGATISMPERA